MGAARTAARLTWGANQDSSYASEERLVVLLPRRPPPLGPT